MCALSAAVGPLQVSLQEKIFFITDVLPWAIKTNGQSEFLLNIYYEKHLEEKLDDLRKQFKIVPAPQMPGTQPKHTTQSLVVTDTSE
jgi:ubiquinone biosynthesis protein COQ4